MNVRRLDSRDGDFRRRLAALAEFDAPDVEAAAVLAEAEGSTAHARSAALRMPAPVAGRG